MENGSAEKEESVIEVKKLITTLHKEMSALQGQLYEYKDKGSAVYACRAELHSLRRILERKVHCITKFPSGNYYVELLNIEMASQMLSECHHSYIDVCIFICYIPHSTTIKEFSIIRN